jgi:uncharacterized cupin superfamily protein
VRRANVFTDEFVHEDSDPPGFRSGAANVGRTAGGEALAVKAFELPAGESLCPYHYEYEEEWLLVLEGTATVRTPEGEFELATGDIVCFPPGRAGAHRVSSGGGQAARVLMFSSAREPAVAVYPDSDKIGVWPGDDGDKVMLKRADGRVDYWEGET